jgi:hypothetical protein
LNGASEVNLASSADRYVTWDVSIAPGVKPIKSANKHPLRAIK